MTENDPVLAPTNDPVIDTSAAGNPSQDTASTVAHEPAIEPVQADPAATPAETPSEPAAAPEPVATKPAVRGRKGKVAGADVADSEPAKPVNRLATMLLPTGVTDNVAELVFPTDEYGITSALKEAFKAAIGRLTGSMDKYEVLEETVALLMAHARARVVTQNATNIAQINELSDRLAAKYGAGSTGYQA